ncbi:uncharacterized protein IL334_000879 [Kwoniella shivajii]|uniref:Phenazine biosynthesis protein n=1 Tax=Kwoniella shivajii TaxID=564305 RepID=A0ABZ1CQE0_9TREE|nr:hypothetical protein IL334_000879 [Kwoniella shivajii]
MTTSLPFHLLNAFVVESNLHSGNQASVVIFPDSNDVRSKDDKWMTLVARDFNYSETAYVVPISLDEDGKDGKWYLRWFTPETEIELCGHATLATSQTLFLQYPNLERIEFETKWSGTLTASKVGEKQVEISLPGLSKETLSKCGIRGNEDEIKLLSKSLGVESGGILGVSDCLFSSRRSLIIQLDESVDVEGLKVNHKGLAAVADSMVVTQVDSSRSTSKELHINSRVFGPGLGIDEDPVTGSSHAYLAGYYLASPAYKYLPKELREDDTFQITIIGHQLSSRGGELHLRLDDGKVKIIGEAFEFGTGTLNA